MTAPSNSSMRGAAPYPAAWRAPVVVALLGLAAWAIWPEQLGLLTRLCSTALMVLSLDLVVGVAGIATLGQAALFGAGAYAAGLYATHVTGEPLSGLLVGLVAGGAVAAISGAFVLRYRGFTLLMLTIAVAQILYSLASRWRDVTGGDDGLSSFFMSPLFGRFEFDLEGRVASLYALAVLVLALYLARRLVHSPFGMSIRGIHESTQRMAALGTPVFSRLLVLYAVAGGMAGVAGALTTQTNAIVGLDSLGFALSAETLVMLVLGGTGRLTGALIGATVFTLLHHTAASINPYHWLFVIGALLMAVVLVPRERWRRQWQTRRAAKRAPSVQTAARAPIRPATPTKQEGHA